MSYYDVVKRFLTDKQIKLVGIDTPVFQGLADVDDPYDAIFTMLEQDELEAIASPLTVVSTVSVVHMKGTARQAVEYENALLRYPNLSFKPITQSVAAKAAKIQADCKCKKQSQAILLALAVEHDAQAVLMDKSGKDIENPPIPIITIDQILSCEAELAKET